MIDDIVQIAARDGTSIGARVYRPDGAGPYPALIGAAPYRFDNNSLPASAQFLWRETGPIEWYVEQGYAYVHMDVRGSGRSGGQFEFLGRGEQNDLYDVIEWIGAQPWCTGKVGGIGQSYFCMLQWFMGALAPPSLACIAAHDGLADAYRAGCYHGGIPCDFFPGYWWYQNRFINRYPASGPSRDQDTDLTGMVAAHTTYDDFWRERSAWEISRPHQGPALLERRVGQNSAAHARQYRRLPARQRTEETAHVGRAECLGGGGGIFQYGLPQARDAAVLRSLSQRQEHRLSGAAECGIRGARRQRHAQCRDLAAAGRQIHALVLEWLDVRQRHVVERRRAGTASRRRRGVNELSISYPGWVAGVVGFGPTGPAGGFDPVRRVLTFTTAPLGGDLQICGPIKLVLYASSTARDTDFFVKLADQFPQAPDDRAKGLNPFAELITRGWLRASHRALDPKHSTELVPYHTHTDPQPLTPNEIYKFEISLEPMAYLIQKGHRLRLEIVNGDSPVSEQLWPHYYRPDKIGGDTIHHDAAHPSELILPISPS